MHPDGCRANWARFACLGTSLQDRSVRSPPSLGCRRLARRPNLQGSDRSATRLPRTRLGFQRSRPSASGPHSGPGCRLASSARSATQRFRSKRSMGRRPAPAVATRWSTSVGLACSEVQLEGAFDRASRGERVPAEFKFLIDARLAMVQQDFRQSVLYASTDCGGCAGRATTGCTDLGRCGHFARPHAVARGRTEDRPAAAAGRRVGRPSPARQRSVNATELSEPYRRERYRGHHPRRGHLGLEAGCRRHALHVRRRRLRVLRDQRRPEVWQQQGLLARHGSVHAWRPLPRCRPHPLVPVAPRGLPRIVVPRRAGRRPMHSRRLPSIAAQRRCGRST